MPKEALRDRVNCNVPGAVDRAPGPKVIRKKGAWAIPPGDSGRLVAQKSGWKRRMNVANVAKSVEKLASDRITRELIVMTIDAIDIQSGEIEWIWFNRENPLSY